MQQLEPLELPEQKRWTFTVKNNIVNGKSLGGRPLLAIIDKNMWMF